MDWKKAAASMVEALIQKGIKDQRVLRAMAAVPRHRFLPYYLENAAYHDLALPIGFDQTISQPYMVARMLEKLRLKPGDKVLDIGTGSGYQAGVLAEMGCQVFSVERVAELAQRARSLLEELGYQVQVKTGDGNLGWPEHAPFNAIVVAAGASEPPEALLSQLCENGRMVIPVGTRQLQRLWVITRREEGYEIEKDIYCNFVPFVGPHSY